VIPLEQLLDGLDVEVEEWDRDTTPTVHYTRGRSGVLALAGGAVVRFSKDSVTVVPARRRTRPPDGNDAPDDGLRVRTTEPDVVTACARIRATYHGAVGVFDHLDEPLVETFVTDDPLRSSLEELCSEIVARKPGSRAMVESLARRCLILLLRRWFEHTERRGSWLAPLEDARLSRAVGAMQAGPEQAFTLSTLAEVAGMSRSVFAERFVTALGESPMEFLKTLRLGRATHLLLRTDLPVKNIASRVGYSSRSSFTRAFLARYGAAPARFRTTAADPAAHLTAVPATG
jgi:AraC-like DNA-binding protein